MEQARADARRDGQSRYQGSPCAYGHDGERYVSNGGCVQCVKDKAVEHRNAKKPIMSAEEIEALRLRGGPNDKATAEAGGFMWYNPPPAQRESYCHWIVGVKGFCPLCGQPTPEPVEVKEELDLAAKLLS